MSILMTLCNSSFTVYMILLTLSETVLNMIELLSHSLTLAFTHPLQVYGVSTRLSQMFHSVSE